MRIDPALRALRTNPAPQRAAQSSLEDAKADWRNDSRNAAIFEDFRRYGAGVDLAECAALRRLFVEPEKSARVVSGLVSKLLPEIFAHPLGQVPFRHQYSGGMAIMQLAAAGEAAISLVMCERRANAARPQTVCFTDSERHEIALAGAGTLQIVRRAQAADDQARLSCRPLAIGEGQSLSLSGMFDTKFIEFVEDRLVILRLSRTAAAPQASLEFRLSDGKLVHRASGNKGDSQHEMMLSLLGRMGREDAAPVMAEMTREGSDHVRWQALRECLSLDTARGFAALSALARDAQDPLASDAGALRAQLIGAHPQLAICEKSLCPA